MKTPQQAILWELWRTGRSDLLIRVISMSLMILLFSRVIEGADLTSTVMQPLAGVTVLMLTICSFFSSLWLGEFDTRQSGFSLRLGFTRPIATSWLVLLPMLYGVAISCICYAVPVLVYYCTIGTNLPIHGPLLLTSSISTGCLAATWGTRSRGGKLGYLALLVTAVGVLVRQFALRLPQDDSWINAMGAAENYEVSVSSDLMTLLIQCALIGTTVWAVNRQRHESTPQRRLFEFAVTKKSSFRSATHENMLETVRSSVVRQMETLGASRPWLAQCGFEFRRAGFVTLVAGIILPLTVQGVILLIPLMNPAWNRQPLTWLVAIAFCPVVYQILGIDAVTGIRSRQGRTDISPFDLTRPLRNDQLASIKLSVITCTTLVAWVIMVIAASLSLTMTGRDEWFQNPSGIWQRLMVVNPAVWLAGLTFLAMTVACGSSMLLAIAMWMPLYSWRLMGFVWGISLNAALLIVDTQHGGRFRLVWTIESYSVAILMFFACVIFAWKAWRSGCFGNRYLFGAVTLWLAWLASTGWMRSQIADAVILPFEVTLAISAMLPLPLFATLLAPIAFATYRHR